MSDAWAALRDGVRRVQRAPAVLFGLWCLTLAAAVQVALTQAAADVPSAAAWLQDLVAQPTDAAAAIALHGAPRDAAALACTSIVAWLFVAGGVLDRYARDRAVRTPGFFAAAGVFFFRFLRLAIAQAVVYAALVTLVPDATAAGAAIALVSVIVDYAKVRMVVEDRRSAIGAIGAAIGFLRRHLLSAAALFAMTYALFRIVVGAVHLMVTAQGRDPAWSAVVATAVAAAVQIGMKLLFWASETALFQATLAHAGYVARPEPMWPESPAAEALM